MPKKVKRDPRGNPPKNQPVNGFVPNSRVQVTSIERHWVYTSAELQIVAYRGGTNDRNESLIGGNQNVIQCVTKGRATFQREGESLEEISAIGFRDTYPSKVDGVLSTYEIKQGNTEFLCIKTRLRKNAPYDVLTFNPSERINISGPVSGSNFIVIAVQGKVDFVDERVSGILDRLETIQDHIEIEPGDTAEGTAIGRTTLLVIK